MAKVYLACLLLCGFAQADQVNCVKWKDANGTVIGTYCRPFTVVAGNGIALSDNHAGAITISTDGATAAAGAGGSDTQINFNSSGVLAGSSGLTWNNSTSTLTATHITGLDNRPFVDMVRDCGLLGDGVTDDAAAANACFLAHPGYEFFFPKTKANGTCNYLFGSTLTPAGAGTIVRGGGGGGYTLTSGTHSSGAEICFSPGTTGIWLDNTGAVLLEDLSLNGQGGTNVQGVPTKLNLPSAANLPIFSRNIATIQRTTNVLTGTISASGNEGLVQQVGSTITIAGVVGDATMNGNCVIATLTASGSGSATNPYGFTCAQNGADSGPFGAVGTINPATTGADSTDGIRVCGNFHKIVNVTVANFARHGINGGSADGGCTSAFSDDLVVRDSVIVGNQGFGIYMHGIDSNAGKFDANSLYYNGIWGANDQSALGNVWEANQASYNALGASSASTPSTKNISTISRTLTSGISQASVVLSSADANLKLGSCVVIAGVTDASFNTTAGQCFFINSFTDSTHFGYEQPGAPANASSSGGTSRMAKFTEAYLSSGLDYGSYKIGTAAQVWSQSFLSNYSEGGQACKFGVTVPVMWGTTVPAGCTPTGNDWLGVYFQLVGGLQTFGTNLSNFSNYKDTSRTLQLMAGISTGSARDFYLQYKDFAAVDTWGVQVINTTAGAAGNYIIRRGTAQSGTIRMNFNGPSTAGGKTTIDAESTGSIDLNKSNGAGTGGTCFGNGAAACVATVDSAGKGTFTALADTTYADITEIAAPANPSAGINRLYADSTAHTLKCLTSAGGSCFPAAASNALLDGSAHSDTLVGSVARGDVIVGNSTPKWARLAIGTTGKYLKSDGTDLAYSTGAASGTGACGANSWASTLNGDSAPTCTQPAFSNISGSVTDAQVPDTVTISLAATATALAADPANCSAGSVAAGITAAGTAEGCAVFAVTKAAVANQFLTSYTSGTGAFTSAQPAFTDISGAATDAQVPDNITVTLAATATALAANPADCTSGQFANAINASGTLACATVWTVSGTSTFTTTAVASGACQTTVTTAATGAATTDVIDWAYSTAPVAATDGRLTIQPYVTANNVNFMRCNNTAASVTPTALTVNWRVIH